MRIYNIICPSCNGAGIVPQVGGVSSNTTRTCPACKGSGRVLCQDFGEDKIDVTYEEI